jgi:RND superfamily putative drug exporter
MKRLFEFFLNHRKIVIGGWAVLLLAGGFYSMRLQNILLGSTDVIQHSPSGQVNRSLQEKLGQGSAYPFVVILQNHTVPVTDARFARMATELEKRLVAGASVLDVRHYWNSGSVRLLGRDGHSALLLVRSNATSYPQAENLTAQIREAATQVVSPTDFQVIVTGAIAMYHDLNRSSSDDLLKAERIGIPLTLIILLFVFRAPLAACLPLLVAVASVTLSLAGLYFLSFRMQVSTFAQNTVSMIGLGAGVDYALFLLSRFRHELGRGAAPREAALAAALNAGNSVLFSGLTVAVGFLCLLLVRAEFLQSLAVGGVLVVLVAVAATLSLLPVLLATFGPGVNWPRVMTSAGTATGFWSVWAHTVMRRPWRYLLPALAILAAFIIPTLHMKPWNVGVKDLEPQMESREGYAALERNFQKGWMGPTVLLLQGRSTQQLWRPESQKAALAMAERLAAEPLVDSIEGYPQMLAALGPLRPAIHSASDLPPSWRSLAGQTISADGTTAAILLFPKVLPEDKAALDFARRLRADAWPEAAKAGLQVTVGGASAIIIDFDHELFGSLWRVVPAMLALTFVVLLVLFKSLLIPLKAILLNLFSVLASYGFLVLVFQNGLGAGVTGLVPPGGLNSFIVLMLFTILFGLSMDYEVFLLSQIREEYKKCGDSAVAVASGLERTAGLISSAAMIMVCLFFSFSFTRLTATREFGLGLAFAVALDATLIRLVLVPALMVLFGAANWWLPEWLKRWPRPVQAPESVVVQREAIQYGSLDRNVLH